MECCYDETWGNGLPLSNLLCIDLKSYKKQGILGEILEDVRTVLLSENTSSSNPGIDNLVEESGIITCANLIPCGNVNSMWKQ